MMLEKTKNKKKTATHRAVGRRTLLFSVTVWSAARLRLILQLWPKGSLGPHQVCVERDQEETI